ncbi:single-stranded DNA-binding protein [Feifania hominis]|uniref:Single-stranded DNA-binding protein n=1 Tax=Feifania hominis TaxID=2763660 RepID=A0A926DG19_9FIRM|nr:single-stranded DNA-binding protein [Feifania hominis]MBC8537191.1 single-stranded DNA-binding protein [Feifania hominis]
MLNKAILMGRLTDSPELKYTPNNIAVCSFTLAVNRSYARPGEERKTDFIDIVAWRSTAEFVSKYFAKGMQVAVEGSIQTRTYEDRQGIKRKAFEVVANEVFFADSKRDNARAVETAAPTFTSSSGSDFEEVSSDDELPF